MSRHLLQADPLCRDGLDLALAGHHLRLAGAQLLRADREVRLAGCSLLLQRVKGAQQRVHQPAAGGRRVAPDDGFEYE